jgi:hypothetical protein
MGESRKENERPEMPSLFIDGYFSQRLRAGDEPKYGYPANHVPETTLPSMEVVTGFLAARKGK